MCGDAGGNSGEMKNDAIQKRFKEIGLPDDEWFEVPETVRNRFYKGTALLVWIRYPKPEPGRRSGRLMIWENEE